MKIIKVQAGERFDNTQFSNEVVDGLALPLTATHTCRRCNTQVSFHKRDFEELAHKRLSNLDSELQRVFDDYARENSIPANDFIDWCCPTCGMASRVYVKLWAGGRHGDYGTTLLIVVELEDGAPAPND